MKIYSIVAVVIALGISLILSGCGLSEHQLAETEANFEDYYAVHSQASGIELSDEEYKEHFHQNYVNSSEAIQLINLAMVSEQDDEWGNRVHEAFLNLRTAVQQYKDLKPSESNVKSHAIALEAMWNYDRAIDMVENFLNYQTEISNEMVNQLFAEAERLVTRAYNQLFNIVEPEDLGLTTEQIERLDALAGIDRRSVSENISPSGEELIGNWGRKDENDKVVIEMSILDDGTHIGYPRGEYPSLSNSFNGKWEFDHARKLITFYVDQNFKDGQEVEAGRDSFVMEVIYFKDGELRMTNIESWSNIHFFNADLD